jgi:hypothetical protein
MSIEATLSGMDYTIQSQEEYIGQLEHLIELCLTTNITNAELKEKYDKARGIETIEAMEDIDDLPFIVDYGGHPVGSLRVG